MSLDSKHGCQRDDDGNPEQEDDHDRMIHSVVTSRFVRRTHFKGSAVVNTFKTFLGTVCTIESSLLLSSLTALIADGSPISPKPLGRIESNLCS
jgi:hypothetical protein